MKCDINKRAYIHFFSWFVFVLIVISHELFEDDGVPLLFLMRLSIGILIFYINYFFLIPKFYLKKKILFYIIGIFVLINSGAHLISFISYVGPFEHEHANCADNEYHHSLGIAAIVYTLFVFLSLAIKMYTLWNENEIDKRDIENRRKASELEALKNQINPHFLFNSLNSICSLAVKKSDETPEAIVMLSDLMRYMLYDATEDMVFLKEEIGYIVDYVNLQKLRLANKKSVKLQILGEITHQKIPPLLLISFIENAFKYGVDTTGDSNVYISIEVEQDKIVFYCLNRISKKQQEDKNSGIGLQNTKQRLEMLYPESHELNIQEKNGNFIVELTLNLS